MRLLINLFGCAVLLASVLALPPMVRAQQAAASDLAPLPDAGHAGLGIAPRGIDTDQPPAVAQQGGADPVVGSVEGHLIYLSDLGEASQTLPENLRGLPFDKQYPVLLDRMIDHDALVMMARRKGLEEQKQVQHDIRVATGRVLAGAYLAEVAAARVTEQGIETLYNRLYANRSATEEVRARHILVTTEAEARKVIEDLRKGADFETLARVFSKDPDAARGGDLGFFRREQVWPGFADVAFSLPPGQVAPDPVKNEFGWHVIKVEEKRMVAPPSLSDVHDKLRRQLLAAAVQQAVQKARGALTIHRFNLDGSEMDNDPELDVVGPGGLPTR